MSTTLGGVCSIQLSYGDIFNLLWSRMEQLASQDFDDLIIRRTTNSLPYDSLTLHSASFCVKLDQ